MARFTMALAMVIAVAQSATAVDYQRDIQPLLKQRCWACHGALKQQVNLRLDTVSLMRQGGDGGSVIGPGRPEESLLLKRVTETDASLRMPPEGAPLTAEQIAQLKEWIADGAIAPYRETPEADPREHWAFKSPVRPSLPLGAVAVQHPLDAFITAELNRNGLVATPPVDKATLLRRVYLDLVGVPPTPEELRGFLADDSLAAYELVVDRLLLDPRHGERWGRHWLDIWRYSDWYGRRHVPDVWNSAPQIWRWRDWVIRSLNRDVGYDDMVRAMLAADEIWPEDDDTAVATGYLIRNWYALNPNDWMRSTVEHTGKAFLGLTFNCAHCHDHKYDPIEHDDYFKFRAFFEPIAIRQDRVAGEADPGPFQEYSYGVLRKIQRTGTVRIFDKNPEAVTWFYTGGDERNRVSDRGTIPPGIPAFLGDAKLPIEKVTLPPRAFYPALQPALRESILTDARAAVTAAEAEVLQAKQADIEPTPAVREALAAAEAAHEQLQREIITSSNSGALHGEQSLVLDASAGRSVLQNGLVALKSLPDGMVIEFTLQILKDAHFNVQFIKDAAQGLTAGYLGFDRGRVLAYQPGQFTEFEAGRYDWSAGQRRFQVSVQLDLPADLGFLTVRSLTDGKLLVDAARIALNGWNPIGDPNRGISLDARTGSMVVLDAIRFLPPTAAVSAIGAQPEPLLAFEFEGPRYAEGRDVHEIEGWMASKYSISPASSVVSRTAANEALHKAWQTLLAARRAAHAPELRLRAMDAKLQAAQTQLASVEARIAADRAKYGEIQAADASALIRAASQLDRQATLQRAEAELLAQEQALADAEAKPADDAGRTKAITAARMGQTTAQAALAKAQATVNDELQVETYAPLSQRFPETSTGRRKALAEWIVGRSNPLTARVAVNHIWSRHFHVPLVASVYDFGRNGAAPTHPQLLDWLAVEFMDSGWSMRHINRLIVTSAAYRRSTRAGAAIENAMRDPDNRLLWRMNTGRMEAEVVRDSLLACAGKLDLQMGGQELENDNSLKTYRRSLYYCVHPEAGGKSPLGELFDAPDPLDCYRRSQTVVPQQALALTNSELVHAMSTAIVQQWPPAPAEQGTYQIEEFVVSMFERILSRRPTDTELRLCLESMEQQRTLLAHQNSTDSLLRACESLVRSLFNHNDFVTTR